MVKRVLKIFSAAIVLSGVILAPVNASEWVRNNNSWQYVYDNGSKATGWELISGDWYYFDSNTNECYQNLYCSYNDKFGMYFCNDGYDIGGERYFFDNNGKMLHDCYVSQGSGYFKYYIKDNGQLDYYTNYGSYKTY